MPSLQRLQEHYRNKPFKILLVDVMEPREKVEEFFKDKGYDFTVVLDEFGRASQLYEVQSHPATFIIAPSGKIVGSAIGYREWDSAEVKAIIDRIMPKGASADRG